MGLTSLAIRRPVGILMVVSALIVLGLSSCSKMQLELIPKVDFPYVTVVTAYPGAGPEEIETQISKKVEDAVASVNGLKTITSTSQDGVSTVILEFNIGVSSDVASADVREKVSAIRANLPTEAKEPVVSKFDTSSQPILYYGLTANRPGREIRDVADNTIKARLAKISGVGSVQVTGGDVREISVGVRRERLDAYGISIQQLVQLVQANNLNFPVGHVIEGPREYSVRIVGEYPDVDAIRNTRLRMPNGQTVRLADMANVQDTVEERRDISLINGHESVAIIIQKTSEGNTVEIARNVRAEIAKLSKELPSDFKFILVQDVSTHVIESKDDVQNSLFLGAFLATLVVFLFLHNLRGTFIVAIAIPTSIMATFLPMYAFGFTLNTMTMLALSLVVGILVDDSIVVLENIHRHLTHGEEPVEAALNGRSEIGLAAIVITMTDVVVFLPIAFMGGITGQFFRSFGITVASAALFSLFMSFTLTPMLASRWYRSHESVETKTGVFGAFERFYHLLDELYRRVLRWSLRFRGVIVFVGSSVLVLIVVAIASSLVRKAFASALMPLASVSVVAGLLLLWRYKALGLIVTAAGTIGVFAAYGLGLATSKPLLLFRFAPDQDQGQVSILGELPAGASLDRTYAVVRQIEGELTSVKDVQNSFASVGYTQGGSLSSTSSGTQYFSFSVKLRDRASLIDSINPFASSKGLRQVGDTEVADTIRQAIGAIPGATIKVAAASGFGGGSSPLQVDVKGDNMEDITRLAEQVLTIFKEEPGVLNADTSARIGKPEQRVVIDRDKAASYGLSIAGIAAALRTSMEGDDTIKYRESGNEYTIRVHFPESERHDTNRIGQIVVGSVADAGGVSSPIRLADVARIFLASGPTKIDRRDRRKLVEVTANVAPGFAPGNIQLSMEKKLQRINFGTNAYSWGGENKMQGDEQGYMGTSLALSIILVYMLMAALFDNLLYPLVIMISLPQAMVGALLGLMAAGHSLSIISMIGIIMLVGLVTKNAILLVDYTNTLRSRGYTREEAILEAGPTRLRPILMTTIAMIMGMLPTALGLGRGAQFRAPLATPVIGGLLLSTLLTLVVIPCVYTYFDDGGRWISRVIFRRKLEPEPAPAPSQAAVDA